MNKLIGFLIRKNRMEQNMSQASLCHGICVVSYLSKIEKGLVQPSEEIVEQLFEALGISFVMDSEVIHKCKEVFKTYYDKIFFDEDTTEEAAYILGHKDELINSELNLSYHIFLIYYNSEQSFKISDEQKDLETYLESYKDYMTEDELFLYYLFTSVFVELEFEERVRRLQIAKQFNSTSNVDLYRMYVYFRQGKYLDVIQIGEKAYILATEEGNVAIMIEVSMLLAICYSNSNEVDSMLHCYRKILNLLRGYEISKSNKIKRDIYYNIGATYVERQEYEKAINNLDLALDHGNNRDLFLCYHKLVIAYGETGNKEKAMECLGLARKYLNNELPKVFHRMYRIIEIRYTQSYKMNKEYEELLNDMYFSSGKKLGYGFARFHGILLIDLYTNQRRYKEAFMISKELNFL